VIDMTNNSMNPQRRIVRVLFLACLMIPALTLSVGEAAAVIPDLTYDATCRATAGPVEVYCNSTGPGACGAAAYASARGDSGAGCFAADYPQ
jgi:hypothetical protein